MITISSDTTWKGTTNSSLRLASLYDANLEIPNWTTRNSLDVVVPPNTTAEIHLPQSISKTKISINGKGVEDLLDVKHINNKDKATIFLVSYGTYNIKAKLISND